MTTVVDVSSMLGEYMLKGWAIVLTDNLCTKCRAVPLMRSPTAITPTSHICVNCDSVGSSSTPLAPSPHSSSTKTESSIRSTDVPSRPSTPPTGVSSVLSSPVFAPAINAEEMLRRRRQSDMASAEIGRRMLQGWALLADECPNDSCYGIPLVRPPKVGGERYPSKECVVCHTVFVDATDDLGRSQLIHQRLSPSFIEDGGVPLSSVSTQAHTNRTTATNLPASEPSRPNAEQHSAALCHRMLFCLASPPLTQTAATTTLTTLEFTAEALESSLRALTHRLKTVSEGPAMEPIHISQAAEAIAKVANALSQIKQLHWSENSALGI
ncbi:hypothetical protein K474DRAFT_1591548 [Panus rudis PR-1116 ss-1]|nr:hypothetical protein K474DRAFT_1591548 [Panus rudis PR-1116 ss-1]